MKIRGNERGAYVVLFGILLVLIVSFVALAVDIGHLAVVKNELQNAADAGALAGASHLYLPDGTVNPDANQKAIDIAVLNSSDGSPVEVLVAEVQRGHWSFTNRRFTHNDTLAPVTLSNYTKEELDLMDGTTGPAFINAVKVVTRRSDQQAVSFFAQIFGKNGFEASAEAVAYLGYTGEFRPGEIDQPIAICEQSIVNVDGSYSCNIGRLINSSSKLDSNTGAWTNYSEGTEEPGSCPNNFDINDLKNIFYYDNKSQDCDGSNENTITMLNRISIGGGQGDVQFDAFRQCGSFFTPKEVEKDPTLIPRNVPWEITVPVVNCDEDGDGTFSNPTGCLQVVGAVTIEIVLITDQFSTGDYSQVPAEMEGWTGDGLTGKARWDDFVDEFNLEVRQDIPAYDEFYQKTIYAKRECQPYTPVGKSGRDAPNFGVLAKVPVLVQ